MAAAHAKSRTAGRPWLAGPQVDVESPSKLHLRPRFPISRRPIPGRCRPFCSLMMLLVALSSLVCGSFAGVLVNRSAQPNIATRSPDSGLRFGVALNRSLDLLRNGGNPAEPSDANENDLLSEPEQQTSRQADSSEAIARRLLVSQLTSLIMNNEPEMIAESMKGSKMIGQLESGADQPPVVNLDTIDSEIQSSSAEQAAALLMNPSGPDYAGGNESEPQDSLPPDTSHSGADQQQQQQQQNELGAEGGETLISCPPDYEYQSFSESGVSFGNLTSEQRQQVLAEADSAGLLARQQPNASSPNAEEQRSGQCVFTGSRMIEVITKIITPILFGIIVVVGFVGNIVVLIVILEDRKTERGLTQTGLLILDLSLADLSFIIFCIPFTGWDYSKGHWIFGQLWCKCNQYLIVVTALSSIYTLVLMSADRFMAIVYPIECMPYRTSRNTLYAITIKWILILIMALPTLQMHGLIDVGRNQFTCRLLADEFNALQFQMIFFVTSYLFPLILIFCLYFCVLKRLWFGSKPHGHKESMKTLESKKKVTKLVASIVVTFAICWFPIQVMLILMRLKYFQITATYVAIQVFAHILGYMNSCVNPIIYAFASESFVNSFKKSSLGQHCYSLFCPNHRDLERTATSFRTIHHSNAISTSNNNNNNNNNNTTSLNHSATSYLQNKLQFASDQEHNNRKLNHVLASERIHANNGNFDLENNVSTTTLLMTPHGSNNNEEIAHHRPDNVTKPLVLEPRDRDLTLLTAAAIINNNHSPINEPPKVRTDKTRLTSANCGGGGGGNTNNNTALVSHQMVAKQQLVARVDRSGNNQVSHMCEPGYREELINP